MSSVLQQFREKVGGRPWHDSNHLCGVPSSHRASARQHASAGQHTELVGIHHLPPELLEDIVGRAALSCPASILLVCKAWQRLVLPDRCVLTQPNCVLPGGHGAQLALLRLPERDRKIAAGLWSADHVARTTAKRALTSDRVRDAIICGASLPAGALQAWTRIECLQVASMQSDECLRSLRPRSLRALALQDTRLDVDGGAALCAALRAATALEFLAVLDCHFANARFCTRLLESLRGCARLRSLELSGLPAARFAALPQLTHFGCLDCWWLEWLDDTNDDDAEAGRTPSPVLGEGIKSFAAGGDLGRHRDEACLARLLHRNATIEALDVSLPWRVNFKRVFASMTGVTRLTCRHRRSDDTFVPPPTSKLRSLRLLNVGHANALEGLHRCQHVSSLLVSFKPEAVVSPTGKLVRRLQDALVALRPQLRSLQLFRESNPGHWDCRDPTVTAFLLNVLDDFVGSRPLERLQLQWHDDPGACADPVPDVVRGLRYVDELDEGYEEAQNERNKLSRLRALRAPRELLLGVVPQEYRLTRAAIAVAPASTRCGHQADGGAVDRA